MAKYYAGSILSAGGSAPFDKASSSDWADMVDGFQHAALQSRLGIPMLYGVDAVHGNNNIYGATIFPHNVGLGATRFVSSSTLRFCSHTINLIIEEGGSTLAFISFRMLD